MSYYERWDENNFICPKIFYYKHECKEGVASSNAIAD